LPRQPPLAPSTASEDGSVPRILVDPHHRFREMDGIGFALTMKTPGVRILRELRVPEPARPA
jgi:hypothetical protein